MVAFRGATLLNKEGSEKETRHIEFDIEDSGLDYRVGDSLGVVRQQSAAAGGCDHRRARRGGRC